MQIQKGDILTMALDGKFDVIIHGCNCQCQMGKGIALSIKRLFPESYRADCKTVKADPSKLGTYSAAIIERNGVQFVIINAYTQFNWRGDGIKADYQAIRNVMKKVKQQFQGKRIGYPKIGAGLAGGDWSIISDIIDSELQGEDHTFVEFQS